MCSRPLYQVLAFEGVIVGQSWVPLSVEWGTNAVKGWYRIHLVDLVGYNPPRFSQNGGPGCPLFRRGPVCRNTVPEKKKVCVLSTGLRVSCQRVRIEF